MLGGLAGNLWQVSDAQHLPVLSEALEQPADDLGDAAATTVLPRPLVKYTRPAATTGDTLTFSVKSRSCHKASPVFKFRQEAMPSSRMENK